jgi:glutamate-5-semialdehyde dehydrogenase
MDPLGRSARRAAAAIARSTNDDRNQALQSIAAAIRDNAEKILAANSADLEEAKQRGLTGAMLDRLMLDADRVEAMAAGTEAIAELADPIGRVIAEWERPNGLVIQRISVPLGVIGIIYESRPNVTADAAALCLKSGNAAILRGGSESFHSSQAIYQCLREGLVSAGIDAVFVVSAVIIKQYQFIAMDHNGAAPIAKSLFDHVGLRSRNRSGVVT